MENPFLSAHMLILPLAFVLTLLFVPVVKLLAQKAGFVSKIDFRRNEHTPRPLLGGVAIFGGVVVACSAFIGLPLNLILPSSLLVVLGMTDDRFQLNAKLKMGIQLAAVALWVALTPADSLLLHKAGLPYWAAIAFHMFWVLGLINAFNMIDGMDGLASGMAVIGFFFLSFFMPGELRYFSLAMSFGCLAHLVFNRPPASIFLGDSGSLLIGFLLSALGSEIAPKHVGLSTLLIPLFILAHPEIDAILAISRRWLNGTPVFQGDKDHIHHKLRKIGLGPHESLLVIYSASLYCGMTALLLNQLESGFDLFLASSLCFSGVSSILVCIYFVEHRLAAQFSQLGTPLLQRHVRVTNDPVLPAVFEACVFDLLPYYKELQMRGIADLNDFVTEFATWTNREFLDAQVVPVGSYSIIVISEARLSRNQITDSFRSLIARHKIMKNSHGLPWGLKFYAYSTDARERSDFDQKFGLLLRARVLESGKAA